MGLKEISTITIDNKYCKISNEDNKEFLSRLDKLLSFKYVGAEFTPAYKNYGWDGKEYLLSKKLMFMTGLLDLVLTFYKDNERSIDIVDNRIKFESNESIDILPNLLKHGITPYDYQLAAIDHAVANDIMIFKHATGSGKSITAALIAAKFNKPTIVYVISKELLFQFQKSFSEYFDQKIGIVGAGHFDIQNITIVSIWTLGKMLGLKKQDIVIDSDQDEDDDFTEQNKAKLIDFVKTCSVHLFDECHVAAAKTIQNIYKVIGNGKIFGFSGTPVRDDGADLLIRGIFGPKIDEVSASELIKRGILAKPFIKFVYIKGSAKFTDTYQTVYSSNIVVSHYRNSIIVNEVKKLLDKGYQVLILYRTIKHGKLLYDICLDRKIDCELLNGKDSEAKRSSVKERLLNKELNCLVASMIYDIGIDVPTLNALVLSGSGKSSVKTLQRIGRVIRNGKEKPYAAVVDFIDDVKFLKKHSKIRKEIYASEPEFEIRIPNNVKF